MLKIINDRYSVDDYGGVFDKYNNLIEVYESISEASRRTGTTITSISYSANGKRKTGGGYIWHFV